MRLLLYVTFLYSFYNYGQTSLKKEISDNLALSIPKVPIKKQFTYAVSVSAYTPYELYINDIPAKKDYDSGSQTAIEINPYLLGNGKHTIRLRLLPIKGNDLVDLDGYKFSHFEFVKYIKNSSGKGVGYDEEIMKLSLPPMPTPLPFMEMKWEVEINDLPYKLEGWSKSKVFKKEDSLEIKKEVVVFYKK